jgi:twitching motility protein PilT
MAVELARSAKDGSDRLWPRLLVLLQDEDWWVRERMTDVLVELAGPKLTQFVAPYLKSPSDAIRRFAVQLIGRLGDVQSIPVLLTVAEADSDWWIREQAVVGIGKVKDPRALAALISLLRHPELHLSLLEAFTGLQAREAIQAAVPLLTSDLADVRLAAAKFIGSFRDPALAPLLQRLVLDEDSRVRQHVGNLLSEWSETSAMVDGAATSLDAHLIKLVQSQGDDLILVPGHYPMMKKVGRSTPLSETVLTHEDTRVLFKGIYERSCREKLEQQGDVDFSYTCRTRPLRFRVNLYKTQGGLAGVFRSIRNSVIELSKLALPASIGRLAELKNGLVLIGGPTGSGKSTTLAALIDHISRVRPGHIVTMEDPIEMVHRSGRSLVNQRELGTHLVSFPSALRAALRQDPDVVLVGEVRDLSTIAAAISAAETGHLVFGTLHTTSVDASVDRLINAFPAAQQDHIRAVLSDSLRAVVCQHLMTRRDTPGRCVAVEVMFNNEAISNLIRKGKAYQIPSVLATATEQGMQTMDWDLMRLLKLGKISAEDAYVKARSKKEFEPMLASSAASAPPVISAPRPEVSAARLDLPSPASGTKVPSPAGAAPPLLRPGLADGPAQPGPRPHLNPNDDTSSELGPVPESSGEMTCRKAWSALKRAKDKRLERVRAVAELRTVMTRDPNCAAAYYFLGRVHQDAGDHNGAKQWFERTLRVDPRHRGARKRLKEAP